MLALRLFAIAALVACRPPPAIEPPATIEPPREPAAEARFGDAAFARLRELMALPRGLGHPDRARSIDAMAEMLVAIGSEPPERIETTGRDPATGDAYSLTSLVAHVRPEAARRFVLGTHFDTRPWADESANPEDHARPVPGANDGTSGVAVVLELAARLPARLPEDVGFSVVLFDGEELGRPKLGGYCIGSREVAARMREGQLPMLARAELGIVLDMVGDAELALPIEPSSLAMHPALVRHVWDTAAALGHTEFDPTPRAVGIVDDHKPLSEAGVPSILVIDRDYSAWHTPDDGIDKVAAQSLHVVGETVLEAIVQWYAEAPRPGRAGP